MKQIILILALLVSSVVNAAGWEKVYCDGSPSVWCVKRLEVPGGWLLQSAAGAITFLRDEGHNWSIG